MYDTNPYEPELDSFDRVRASTTADGEPTPGNSELASKTGTTTVGLTTEDGVIIGTDRRASRGGRFVSNKNVQKVEQVHPTAAMTLVGSVGGAQSFIRTLRSEARLYEKRRGEPMSIQGLATLAGNFARGGRFVAINPILGGVDSEGSHVYSIDPAGGVMEDEYTVTGSGMQLAHGALEGEYDPDLSLEAATALTARAVQAASERDTGSGNGLVVATVTEDGVEIVDYDDPTAIL
jgi:proteasome beta subunit